MEGAEETRTETGVQLPRMPGGGVSASALLRQLMAETSRAFPEEFRADAGPDVPAPGAKDIADRIAGFEARRGASTRRPEIARYVTDLVQTRFRFESRHGSRSLEEEFAENGATLPVAITGEADHSRGESGSAASREALAGARVAVAAVVDRKNPDDVATPQARAALAWALERAFDPDWMAGNLRGRKFALLGGTAELSPLRYLLGAGAEVFTTHTTEERMREAAAVGASMTSVPGRLWSVDGGADLLQSPAEIANTLVRTFSEGQRMDLVVLAYRGGRGREWRLSAAMDGIVRTVARAGLLRSVTYYLSPSVTTEISAETAALSERRFREQYGIGKRLLNGLAMGSLWKGNVVREAGRCWSRSGLSYQGASYIAANLFGKVYPAEVYAAGALDVPGERPIVSANVGPIARTASTDVARARVLLEQAGHFGITVFEPAVTRLLMYLLMIHDLFREREPDRALFGEQVHGGVFTNPWSLESVVRLAHLRAMLKRGGRNGASFGLDPALRSRR